ncbi:hypothetical protein [Algoriphagus sp.]|uniref:hypothetical protein n=1 Tax=Algoriphagus sp. TaxID=1872435 RepID=UPI0025D605F3|nr:hypothetical protein [Algoriphagus sp.]
MEKSIENIWKDGFLNGEALVAPKVNDLYNRKSVHIIDKFKRMFKVNIWAIIAASTVLWIGSYFAGALIAGSILLIMMIYIAFSANNDLKALEKLDKGQSSYNYLKSFKGWIEDSIEHYGNMYRIVYPALILTFYFGLWFSDTFSVIREKVMENSNDIFLGVHIYSTIPIIVGAILMSILSKKIHREDIKTVYGGIIKKLDDVIAEMEELREAS